MIISRTPYRISFFGGGTDYPSWYLKYGGSVLATTIDKYCFISLRYLPPFFEHRNRIVYSRIESTKTLDEIDHPSVRETLRFLGVTQGLEIHHDGDLPARSGMGSSSAFTVGLLHALYALNGTMPTKKRLAMESIHIEQGLIHETVGSQDQVSAAYGGFNHIVFHPNGEISVRPIIINHTRRRELDQHLMLFYTGIKRTAANIAKSYVEDVEVNRQRLERMSRMVTEGIDILTSEKCICHFGELLHETWKEKRKLSSMVSNDIVDAFYERALNNGALGGKVIGAGGGGFLLLFVPPSNQGKVRQALKELIHVPFEFEFDGSQIIFYDQNQRDFADVERQQDRQAIAAFREISEIRIEDKAK